MHHHGKRRPTHIHWNILTWDCDQHDPHRVIVAGLDGTADLVADLVARHPSEHGGRPHLYTDLIPLDDARAAAYRVDHDDLPF